MESATSVAEAKFLEAARSGDLRLLKKLESKLDNGGEGTFAKIKDIDGRTALHFAAAAGQTDVCKYLIKGLKFDVNVQEEAGETALLYATLAKQLETVVYLLDNGASITKTNNRGFTPLHYAAITGCKDLIELLISRGADIEADSETGTPLACATYQQDREAVKILLQNNANPNRIIHNKFAPVMMSSSSSLEITDLLVKAGADPNINLFDSTPLHSAVEGKKVEIIKYLLKAGANPNVLAYNGLTPLETAATLGDLEAVSVLFPVTSPIQSIPDWSINGLMKYVKSEEARQKIARTMKQTFNMAKSKGEDAFKRKDYFDAIYWYTAANSVDPSDATMLSNRSLCYALVNLGSAALSDAKACVSMRPDWPKAHYREGAAWKLLKNPSKAMKSFSCALKLDPDNQEIRKAMREAVEAKIAATRI